MNAVEYKPIKDGLECRLNGWYIGTLVKDVKGEYFYAMHTELRDWSAWVFKDIARKLDILNHTNEHSLRDAVNASCSCGGKALGDGCCPACEVWHRMNK